MVQLPQPQPQAGVVELGGGPEAVRTGPEVRVPMGHDFTLIRRVQNPTHGEESGQSVLQQLEVQEEVLEKERHIQQHLLLPQEAYEQVPERVEGCRGEPRARAGPGERIVQLPAIP